MPDSQPAAQAEPAKKKRTRTKRYQRRAGSNVKADLKPALSSTTKPQSNAPTAASNPPKSRPIPLVNTRQTGQSVPKPAIQPTARTRTLVDQFFDRPAYRGFPYNPKQPIIPQYERMLEVFGWHGDDHLLARMKTYEDLLDVLVSQFNSYYGDGTSLETWKGLCVAMKIRPIPTTIEEARHAVGKLYVSPIDLIEHKRIGTDVPVFHYAVRLDEYRKTSHKGFPSSHRHAGGVLQFLMKKKLSSNSHIDQFFQQPIYAAYEYSPYLPVFDQFWEMCEQFGWSRGDPPRESAYKKLRSCLVLEFNRLYGEDVDSLEVWVGLCLAIGISPIPDTMVECRTVVARTHVNIVDLVEHGRLNEKVRIFRTVYELSKYTKATCRVFSRDDPLAGGVLQYLLREIVRPENEERRNRIQESLGRMKL